MTVILWHTVLTCRDRCLCFEAYAKLLHLLISMKNIQVINFFKDNCTMIMQQYFDSAHLASLETQFASQETRYFQATQYMYFRAKVLECFCNWLSKSIM